jgi:hypothetical protein
MDMHRSRNRCHARVRTTHTHTADRPEQMWRTTPGVPLLIALFPFYCCGGPVFSSWLRPVWCRPWRRWQLWPHGFRHDMLHHLRRVRVTSHAHARANGREKRAGGAGADHCGCHLLCLLCLCAVCVVGMRFLVGRASATAPVNGRTFRRASLRAAAAGTFSTPPEEDANSQASITDSIATSTAIMDTYSGIREKFMVRTQGNGGRRGDKKGGVGDGWLTLFFSPLYSLFVCCRSCGCAPLLVRQHARCAILHGATLRCACSSAVATDSQPRRCHRHGHRGTRHVRRC